MSNSEPNTKISVPQFTLPKGGGALKGIGETFQPNHFSGTGSFSIPIETSPCRDFEPAISLDYHSGAGNGPFGLGFSLSIPNITRRTDKRIPKYDDSDIFMLANAEDLVPGAVRNDGEWTVTLYHPRNEGLFAKIEHWINADESYWKVITKENITSIYGKTANARIADPQDSRRVFQWLIEETYDAKGSKIEYSFEPENHKNTANEIYEQSRVYEANKYLRSIRYGNYFAANGQEAWAFEVVFDYGDYNLADNYLTQPGCDPYRPEQQQTARLDPFSTYRSGFEIRTCRLCRNILMFHHLPNELGNNPCLTRATRLTYRESAALTQLTMVKVEGFRRKADGSYASKSMPPLEFGYSPFDPAGREFQIITVADEKTFPGPSQYHLVDLHGDGLPGLLYSNNHITLYWKPGGSGKYGSPEPPVQFPVERDLRAAAYSLISLEGNGKLDLVVGTPQRGGFYECNPDGSWKPYRDFTSYALDYVNPRKEMLDYDGNGIPEIAIFEDKAVRIYPSRQKEGYGAPIRSELTEDFPATGNEYAGEVLSFTDLFGDGLTHRVRIRNGTVECWPHLGYGRFGKKVLLGNAPRFAGGLDASRLFLADVDGSGTTDLIYVESGGINIYFNRSGNSFSDPLFIPLPETYTSLDQISFGDVKGNGTACLIFTKTSPAVRHYYYDFAGETKPYLLQQIDNNLGALTRIGYCSSVKFYLEDRQAGKPWKTKLPFPVQVVERVESIDRISGYKLVTCCKYHDGYYDYAEREFRGFGFVEEWDTENFENYNKAGLIEHTPLTTIDQDLYVPPVYTKRWYHTGAFAEADTIAQQYRDDYYRYDTQAYSMPASSFDREIEAGDAATLRQACRALQGRMLREEIYADDNSDLAAHPYTVTESNYHIRLLQPKGDNEHAVFLVHSRETISYHYERNAEDPRIMHQFTLETDPYGNITKSCQVYYPRRRPVYPEQARLKATAALNSFSKPAAGFWRHSTPYEHQTFEIGGLELKPEQCYFTYDAVRDQVVKEALTNPIGHDDPFTPGLKQARRLTWTQDYYWNAAQDSVLPLGESTAQALLHHSQTAVFAAEFTQSAFGGKVSPEVLEQDGGYVLQDGYWWNRGLVRHYFPAMERRFYLPCRIANSFVAPTSSLYTKTALDYDPYCLAIVSLRQYLTEDSTNDTSALIDYYTLKPKQVTDINDNISQVLFDPLGMVIVTSRYGDINGSRRGDMDLNSYQSQPESTFEKVLQSLEQPGENLYLKQAAAFFFYDLLAWSEKKQPARFISLLQETHASDLQPGAAGNVQVQISYTDGFGREIEKKVKADPGEMVCSTAASGKFLRAASAERWTVSGRTVYNNKGKPAKQYQPFFSTTPDYEDAKCTGLLSSPAVIRYDPLLRQVRMDTPKGKLPNAAKVLGFFTKVEFTPWEEKHFDQNDTIRDASFFQAYQEYIKNTPQPTEHETDEQDALLKAACCYNTPEIKILDTMGHAFLELRNNLGAILPEAFREIAAESAVSPEEIWNELKTGGYLDVQDTLPGGWLTTKFQPYAAGFKLALKDKYQPFSGQITNLLRQSCLITYHGFDIQGREILAIDPRLYYTNVTQQTEYYNNKYRYAMEGKEPLITDSADAGPASHLGNIFGNLIRSWSPRGFNRQIYYDKLQRPVEIRVREIGADGTVITDNTVEVISYGEMQAQAKARNLRGQRYQHKDQAGIIVNSLYGLAGEILAASRQLAQDYKNVLNWQTEVPLETEIHQSKFAYNALQHLISETTPDGSVTINTYNRLGLLDTIAVRCGSGRTEPIIDHIEYSADSQKTRISYANGVQVSHTYEDTTRRLIGLTSTRPDKDAKGNPRAAALQDITYMYDPVGNIIRIRDKSCQTVFCSNQKVEPLADYTYDALYRLIAANGRQHPGINANLSLNSGKYDGFVQSDCPALPKDANKLENYAERYCYDEAGNLIETAHTATNSWTRRLEIHPGSNRLKTSFTKNANPSFHEISYDPAGNQKLLYVSSAVDLSWNYCENLVQAGIIQRPDEPDDCDYYTYDGKAQRARKVSERLAGGGTVTHQVEKIYLGNYEIKRLKSANAGQEKITLNRQTLKIMDKKACVAIIHYWTQDDQKREVDQPGTLQLRYQTGNHLGSVSMELDNDARLISYEEYFPYGGTAIIAGRNQTEVRLKEYRYAGKECDDGTGLYYYGARYYAPWLGRWLKPDPAGTADGLNVYAFVGNNPVSKLDVDGHMGFWAALAGTAATLGIGVAGGYKSGHGMGTASGSIMGAIAGAAGAALSGVIAGAGLGGIAAAAACGAGIALVSAALGGWTGRTVMENTAQNSSTAAKGTITAGIVGGALGAAGALLSQGTLAAGIGVATGLGSAVLSSGAHLGILGGIAGQSVRPVELSDASKIVPAVPPSNVGAGLLTNRMLLVMGPQQEAMRRYLHTYQADPNAVFQLDPVNQGGQNLHVVAAHGLRGYVMVPTGAGGKTTRPMSIENFADYVQSQLTTKGFVNDRVPIKFISCFGGAIGLESNAQVLANKLNRTVYAFPGCEDQGYAGPWKQYRPKH